MNEHGMISDSRAARSTARSLLAIATFLILALAASCGGGAGGSGGQPAGEGSGGASPAGDRAIARQALGEANAPVVLTEYGDYQ